MSHAVTGGFACGTCGSVFRKEDDAKACEHNDATAALLCPFDTGGCERGKRCQKCINNAHGECP